MINGPDAGLNGGAAHAGAFRTLSRIPSHEGTFDLDLALDLLGGASG